MIKCPCCGFEFETGSVGSAQNEDKNPLVVTVYHRYEYKPTGSTFLEPYRCVKCGKRNKDQFDLTDCVGFGGDCKL